MTDDDVIKEFRDKFPTLIKHLREEYPFRNAHRQLESFWLTKLREAREEGQTDNAIFKERVLYEQNKGRQQERTRIREAVGKLQEQYESFYQVSVNPKGHEGYVQALSDIKQLLGEQEEEG
jgi:hypothetical protein